MLEALRHWAAGWVASILIGLLVLSFAIWGIADVFTGYGGSSLATVGSQEISTQDFQKAFREELQGLSQQAGRQISAAQAQAIGLDRQVLDRLTALSAIESHAVELGLELSEATLVDGLKNEPMFQGIDGKFSRQRFAELLAQNGLSEGELLSLRRSDKLRAQILKALEATATVPAPLIGVLHGWREEKRTVEYATIDPAKVLKLKDPTEEELKAAYEQDKPRYKSEPMRELYVLLLAIDALKKKVRVPDQAVKDAYEGTKASYDKPEKRRIQQIAFPDVVAARAAKKEIDSGMSFEDAAKKAGAKEGDIDLGLLSKSQMIDPVISGTAFSLKKDAVSDAIEGAFAVVLVRVTQIETGKISTFDEVKGEVRAKLATEMALVDMQTVYNEIDDALAAGTPIAEIARRIDLPFFEIGAVDRNNKTGTGETALQLKDGAQIITAGFAGEIGVEQDPVQLSDGGYAWVEVIAKTPAKQRSYDEVATEVRALWVDNQRRKALSEIAAKLAARLSAGEAFDAIAKEVGGKVEVSEPVTRAKIPTGLNESAMTQAFVVEAGRASSAETSDGASRVLFRVKEVTAAAKPTDEQHGALSRELTTVLQREQSQQYIKALQSRYAVQVNEALFARLLGGETQ